MHAMSGCVGQPIHAEATKDQRERQPECQDAAILTDQSKDKTSDRQQTGKDTDPYPAIPAGYSRQLQFTQLVLGSQSISGGVPVDPGFACCVIPPCIMLVAPPKAPVPGIGGANFLPSIPPGLAKMTLRSAASPPAMHR